jgi:hypothetical protein
VTGGCRNHEQKGSLMSDYVIPPPEPNDLGGLDPERLSSDVAALSELVASGVELDGQAQVCESTWVIYGHTSYEGEVIVGEYQDSVEASEVLRAARRQSTDPDRTVP